MTFDGDDRDDTHYDDGSFILYHLIIDKKLRYISLFRIIDEES